MAVLKHPRVALAATACALAASCASTGSLGHVEVSLSDSDNAAAGPGEHVEAEAFIDPDASRYAPHGLYVYFEVERADASSALIELDVPTDAPEGASLPSYQASYRELSGARLRFASTAVRGRLVIPWANATALDASCACDDIGFALTFVDAGKDGRAGTADDAVRRLSLGRIGLSHPFCRERDVTAEPEDLRLTREPCRAASASETARPNTTRATQTTIEPATPAECTYDCYQTAPAATASSGCGAEDGYGETYAAGGCYDDQGCGSSCDDASSGCESETQDSGASGCSSGASGDDDASGCQGDGAGASGGGDSGCEGDTADDSASCSVRRDARWALPSSFGGTGIPVLLACLVQLARARHCRRRRARATSAAAKHRRGAV